MREEEMRTSSSGYFGEGVRRRFGGPWFGLYWWVVGGLPRPGKLGKVFLLFFFFCFHFLFCIYSFKFIFEFCYFCRFLNYVNFIKI